MARALRCTQLLMRRTSRLSSTPWTRRRPASTSAQADLHCRPVIKKNWLTITISKRHHWLPQAGRRHRDGFADFTKPDKKYVVFSGGMVSYYQAHDRSGDAIQTRARTRLTSRASWCWVSAAAVNDLDKSYDVKFGGMENDEHRLGAGKLELMPKSPRVKNMFNLITLWIYPARGVSVQQRFGWKSPRATIA